MSFFIWLQFALVCLLGAMSPGPSLAVIIRNSISFNRLSGIVTSIGHGLGIGVYATVTVIGLGIIIETNGQIFFLIQISGSAFLILLGILYIFSSNQSQNLPDIKIHANSFIQGFAIALINPKILIFFIAIYSQFIHANADLMEKTILISTSAIIDATWYIIVSIIVTGYGLKNLFQKNKYLIQKIIGFLLIIIALSLLYKLIFV